MVKIPFCAGQRRSESRDGSFTITLKSMNQKNAITKNIYSPVIRLHCLPTGCSCITFSSEVQWGVLLHLLPFCSQMGGSPEMLSLSLLFSRSKIKQKLFGQWSGEYLEKALVAAQEEKKSLDLEKQGLLLYKAWMWNARWLVTSSEVLTRSSGLIYSKKIIWGIVLTCLFLK